MTMPKMSVGRPKKDEAWKAMLIKMARIEDEKIENSKERLDAIRSLLED